VNNIQTEPHFFSRTELDSFQTESEFFSRTETEPNLKKSILHIPNLVL